MLGTGAVGAGSATQQLVEQAQGSDLETTPSTALDADAATGGLGIDADTGLGVREDPTQEIGPDTAPDTGQRIRQDTFTGLRADTVVDTDTRLDQRTTQRTRTDLTTRPITGRGTFRTEGFTFRFDTPRRPPRIPDLPDFGGESDGRLDTETETDSELIDSGITSGEEAAEETLGNFALGGSVEFDR